MSNRSISVNTQVEHEFGNHTIYPQAILIEDINHDNVTFNYLEILLTSLFKMNSIFLKKNELIIGTTTGEILIYKGSLSTPWLRSGSKQMHSVIIKSSCRHVSKIKSTFILIR